jgi:hypothetical protein
VVAPTGATAVERGVFAEIAIDRRATAQGTGILLAAALMEGGGSSGLVIASGTFRAGSSKRGALLWRPQRPRPSSFGGSRGLEEAGGRSSASGELSRSHSPIVLGAFGFAGSLVGGALAVPSIVRAVAETQRVRIARWRSPPSRCRSYSTWGSSRSWSSSSAGTKTPRLLAPAASRRSRRSGRP